MPVVMVTVPLLVMELHLQQILHVDLCHIINNISGMVVMVTTLEGH